MCAIENPGLVGSARSSAPARRPSITGQRPRPVYPAYYPTVNVLETSETGGRLKHGSLTNGLRRQTEFLVDASGLQRQTSGLRRQTALERGFPLFPPGFPWRTTARPSLDCVAVCPNASTPRASRKSLRLIKNQPFRLCLGAAPALTSFQPLRRTKKTSKRKQRRRRSRCCRKRIRETVSPDGFGGRNRYLDGSRRRIRRANRAVIRKTKVPVRNR